MILSRWSKGDLRMSIEIKNVTKKFGDNTALNNVSISFGENKIYGLLGRNGAGKSTLLNIITNRLFATEGEVTIDNLPACENDKAQEKNIFNERKNALSTGYEIKSNFKMDKEFLS